jgi:polyphosphate kinase
LMPRNLDHRVEILFPLSDDKIVARVRDELLAGYLRDTVNARRMLSDGTYVRVKSDSKTAFNCQDSWIPKRRSSEFHESAEVLALKQRVDED